MIRNSRSRHPEGVTNRDCSTVYVDLVHRNAQLFAVSNHHHSESFIDFPEVNVPDTQAVVVQESADSDSGGQGPVCWLERCVCVANYPGQGGEAQLSQPSLVSQQSGRCPVSQLEMRKITFNFSLAGTEVTLLQLPQPMVSPHSVLLVRKVAGSNLLTSSSSLTISPPVSTPTISLLNTPLSMASSVLL